MLPLPGSASTVGDRYVTAYTPSVTSLLSQRHLRRTRARTYQYDFVGFGDPAFQTVSEHGESATEFRSAGVTLSRLRGSGDEVRAIAAEFGIAVSHLPGSVPLSTARYRSRQHHARFVHFATHGILNDEWSMYSGLALAPPTAAESTSARASSMICFRQGRCTCFPYRRKRWSVLHAALGWCLRSGEGMVGMVRSLFCAGAVCVVVSLWPVDDRITSILMLGVLSGSSQRPLRRCRYAFSQAREPAREWSDPVDWAAFIVVGAGW